MGKFIDLTGKTFGRLHVLYRDYSNNEAGKRKRTKWMCECECGKRVSVDGSNLTSGAQISCGCFHKERVTKLFTKHGMTNSRLYGVWGSIKSRCYNPNTYAYKYYGARGISMCESWKNDFSSFLKWAYENGYDEANPRGVQTIDRIDVNGNYCPENCRFCTQQEQMNNVRTNHTLTYQGETKTIAEWSRVTGISQEKIRRRVSIQGWTVERALTTV